MKLRLDLGDVDLSFQFNISPASVSRYFNYWIDRLFVKFSFLLCGQSEKYYGRLCPWLLGISLDRVL